MVEVDPVDGLDVTDGAVEQDALLDREVDLEALDLHQRAHRTAPVVVAPAGLGSSGCRQRSRRPASSVSGGGPPCAVVLTVPAARRERAPLLPRQHLRRRARDRGQAGAARRVEPRDAGQQAAGVGVAWVGEEVTAVGGLHDAPGVHHVHGVAEPGHDPEVVGDHQQRRVGVGHQGLEDLEHLGLDGHVERGRRLVGDEQARLAGQRHRDEHPLPHAAGELVGVLPQPPARVGDADLGQQVAGAASGLLRLDVEVPLDDLADLHPDGHHRVERGHRVLEDHRDLLAPQARRAAASTAPAGCARRTSPRRRCGHRAGAAGP